MPGDAPRALQTDELPLLNRESGAPGNPGRHHNRMNGLGHDGGTAAARTGDCPLDVYVQLPGRDPHGTDGDVVAAVGLVSCRGQHDHVASEIHARRSAAGADLGPDSRPLGRISNDLLAGSLDTGILAVMNGLEQDLVVGLGWRLRAAGGHTAREENGEKVGGCEILLHRRFRTSNALPRGARRVPNGTSPFLPEPPTQSKQRTMLSASRSFALAESPRYGFKDLNCICGLVYRP